MTGTSDKTTDVREDGPEAGAQADAEEYFSRCLFFTANELARTVGRMADQAFRVTGLSPSHAFLLMVVDEKPDITPGELADFLALRPSTVTRFVENLELRGFVSKGKSGRRVLIRATASGSELIPRLRSAWKDLYNDYSAVLGQDAGDDLTARIHQAALALNR